MAGAERTSDVEIQQPPEVLPSKEGSDARICCALKCGSKKKTSTERMEGVSGVVHMTRGAQGRCLQVLEARARGETDGEKKDKGWSVLVSCNLKSSFTI